jgi:hypothetical protein
MSPCQNGMPSFCAADQSVVELPVEKLPRRMCFELLMRQSLWPDVIAFSLFTDALCKIGALLFHVDCTAEANVYCVAQYDQFPSHSRPHQYSEKLGTQKLSTTFVRFDVLTAVTMKNGVFWDVKPCGSCKNRRFGGT